MMRRAVEPAGRTLAWSLTTIAGLLLGAGASRVPALAPLWDAASGAVARARAEDRRTAGYYEALLDANGRLEGAAWWDGGAAVEPANWPRLHETEGVVWDEPFQRFRLRPGSRLEYKGAALDVDAEGVRDRPVAVPKPDGVRRIAMVGSSILMGSGVGVESTFENLVEDAIARGELGERGRVELINFGVAGYRFDQLADVVLERIDRYEPDAVVVILNDLAVNPNWSRHVAWMIEERRDLRYDYLRDIVRASGATAEDDPSRLARRLAPYRADLIRGALRVMRDRCAEEERPLVLLAVAQPATVAPLRSRIDELRPALDASGVPLRSLLAAYDDHPDPESLWIRPWDRHPDAEGHRLLAAALLDLLRRDAPLADMLLGAPTGASTGETDE